GHVVDIPPVMWAAGAAKTAEIVAAVADIDRVAWADFESCRSPVCLAYSRRAPMQAPAALLDHFHLQNHYLASIIPLIRHEAIQIRNYTLSTSPRTRGNKQTIYFHFI